MKVWIVRNRHGHLQGVAVVEDKESSDVLEQQIAALGWEFLEIEKPDNVSDLRARVNQAWEALIETGW